MAHIKKFTRGSATRILQHCKRVKNSNGEYLKYKTGSEINNDKTKDNYNISYKDIPLKDEERLKEILDNTYHMNRKDVNVMCDWVVTLPKDYQGDSEEFFKYVTAFLSKRYGKDSFVGAYVHMDETTPHLHYCFVPRVWDEKKERYKVSAKKLINKADLNSFHNDLSKFLEEQIEIDPELIYSGKTKKEYGGNKSIQQLKLIEQEKEKLIEEKNALNDELMALKQKNDLQTDINTELERKNMALEQKNEQLEEDYERLLGTAKKLKNWVLRIKDKIEKIKPLMNFFEENLNDKELEKIYALKAESERLDNELEYEYEYEYEAEWLRQKQKVKTR